MVLCCFFFFQAEDGIRDLTVTGVQTCALPILIPRTASFGVAQCGPDEGVADLLARADAMLYHAKSEGRDRVEVRSEEHTSELQSQSNLVCRLLLEKKKKR